jgi:hypothetical protein
MPTKQPIWKFLANLGDASPIEHGGYFVYRDETGVYPEEAEFFGPDDDGDEKSKYTIYRFSLERLKLKDGYLVPARYDSSWPHPVERYDEWFHKDLEGVANAHGTSKEILEQMFISPDPLTRALGYRIIGSYHGFENLDHYPLTNKSKSDVKERYRDELKTIRR